jgi:uncharacterized protein (TIGR02996 family)
VPVVVEIRTRNGDMREEEFDRDEITIGRVQDNDIVLPMGNVSKRHARIVHRDGRLIMVDLKSTNGTYVNGRKLTSPLVINQDAKIYIGDFTMQVRFEESSLDDEDTLEVDATELRLLSGVAQSEAGSRLVYADWLEGQGDVTRAEFLRIQEAFLDSTVDDAIAMSQRMRELAEQIDVSWRLKVARPMIENCSLGFELECPRDWGSLSPTEKGGVRFCGACSKRVYYCGSVGEARTHAQMGNCVAVDIVAIRRPHDLEREHDRPMRMGMIMPVGDD